MTSCCCCYEVSKQDVTMLLGLIIFFHCYFCRLYVYQQTPDYIFISKDAGK